MIPQVHFAEEWNELHHLQIMESLGGDQLWWDRFLAQHSAIFYFWVLILFYTFAPRMAYVFSELVEVSSVTQSQQAFCSLLELAPVVLHLLVLIHVRLGWHMPSQR